MSFRDNILKARSHVAFCVGLVFAAGIAMSVETGVARSFNAPGFSAIDKSEDQLQPAALRELSSLDRHHALVAWKYFEENTNAQTGLVNSVHQYPSTTIWDQASYLLGLISAERIGIIDQAEFDLRMGRVLETLSTLPLFDGKLPNKAYDTRSIEMTDYTNTPSPMGIGWSALDVARISVPLNVLVYDYPTHAAKSAQILSHWNFDAMIKDGVLYGARLDEVNNLPEKVQEGRLGYEEYGARAAMLLGLDTLTAIDVEDYLALENVEGVKVATDSRSYAEFDAHNYVVSEPYILTALEFGFDRVSHELAYRVFRAQQNRFERTGVLTAVSEDNIDQEPYFLYNTVFANGEAWNTIAENGESYPELRTISTKTVFGWDAIFETDYTATLKEAIAETATTDRGFVSGIYEADGTLNDVATANTNAIILQSLQYKMNGPLITSRFSRKEDT